MAIAIKSIPVLKAKAATAFTSAVTANSAKKSSVDFSKQVSTASKILAKAKFNSILGFLFDKCTLQVYNEELETYCEPFDCGNEDLNDFFQNDALNYQSELLGKTYCFTLDEDPKIIVCAFTISNDSIKTSFLPNSRKKKVIKDIPRQKQMKSYPAVLIGRLGVNNNFRNVIGERDRVGKQLMDFIKSWFIDGANKTGCRFIVVDSYNTTGPLKYYSDNGFVPLFSTEEQEKEFTDIDVSSTLETRLMFYDLILLKV